MKDVELSEHFTLKELTVSQTALRKGIDNTPGYHELLELKRLCEEVLEPVRRIFADRPVIITSGYRSPALNAAICGSSATSQHMKGQAADFVVPGLSNHQVIIGIKWGGVHYDQLIYEFGESGWIHVSRSDKPRREVFAYVWEDGKRTVTEFV